MVKAANHLTLILDLLCDCKVWLIVVVSVYCFRSAFQLNLSTTSSTLNFSYKLGMGWSS